MTEFDLSTREGRWKHFGSVDPVEGTKPTTKQDMTHIKISFLKLKKLV